MTMHYNALDPEIMDLLSLKTFKLCRTKRIKDIDYSFGFNEEFARRVAKMNLGCLLIMRNVLLAEAMYGEDQSKFIEIYIDVEKNPAIKKTFVNARDVCIEGSQRRCRNW